MINSRKYEYSRTGLSYFYEKQNVMSKLSIEERAKRLKEKVNDQNVILNNYVEFKYMDDSDIVIVIEHWYCFIYLVRIVKIIRLILNIRKNFTKMWRNQFKMLSYSDFLL